MILLSLKFIPYITIKDAIPLAAKNRIHSVCKQTHTHARLQFIFMFLYTYLLSPILAEAVIQKEWMLGKREPCVKYSNGTLFT